MAPRDRLYVSVFVKKLPSTRTMERKVGTEGLKAAIVLVVDN